MNLPLILLQSQVVSIFDHNRLSSLVMGVGQQIFTLLEQPVAVIIIIFKSAGWVPTTNVGGPFPFLFNGTLG